ncbi:MAG: LysM peptidoglycan-binding domain-containing M23 family metallopeptidase [Candidatus Omnitrophota bacterium]
MFKILFLFLILALTSCASTTTIKKQALPFQPSPSPQGTYYFVKKGDSLWKISKEYNISVAELAKENKIVSAQSLKAGQKIFIPRSHSAKNNSFFLWPVKGEIINFFNEKVDYSPNKGLNIKTSPGCAVQASEKGKVIFSNYLKGWGKTVMLQHSSDFYTIYANLDNTLVEENMLTERGQIIGEVASDKNADYILHFEIRKKHIPQDPLKYLN